MLTKTSPIYTEFESRDHLSVQDRSLSNKDVESTFE